MRPSRRPMLFVAVAILMIACRHRDDEAKIPLRLSRTTSTDAGTPAPLRAGDIRITSMDGKVDLALIGDSISGGLSPVTLAKVRRETDTSAVTGSGFGASIEKMVKGSVQSALGTRVIVPLSSVQDVRYDGRKLVFDWNGRPETGFATVDVDHKDVLESFSSEDAQRFVIAVRARQRERSHRM